MRKLFILLIVVSSLQGCNDEVDCKQTPENFEQLETISITRLENNILDITTPEELHAFGRENSIINNYFLRRGDYPNDSIMAHSLIGRFTNPHIDTLQLEINRVFEDISWLEKEFTTTFSYLKHYYPEFKIPKVQTVATGFNNGADLYISDSLIVIGLDFYLGKGAKYRPLGFPEYILERYQKEYIVPSCALLYGITPTFNKTDMKDKTMLAEMITYGKSFYFAKTMMPCTPDSLLIWYSNKELVDVANNQEVIWAHFLDNELLFNTDKFLKQKYTGERPKTQEIGENCPGRIGTWLGWEIVSQYAERNDATLYELMDEDNAITIFEESKYRPRR